MASKLWGGRFSKAIDPHFEIFSNSIQWDIALKNADLKVDQAHVKALFRCGVLSKAEHTRFVSALNKLQSQELNANDVSGAEDVHTAIQNSLKKILGPLADKIHTGRSRNDLVSQSSRIFAKEYSIALQTLITKLQFEWVGRAEQYQEFLIPGMTHMQNAQVVSQAHIFMSYVEMLERSKLHLEHAKKLADVCVLGSGALAGVTFALDQKQMAKDLGLSEVTRNSYDTSGDRDFILSLLFALSSLAITLSRIAEDLMLSQTHAVGIADIDQAFCTGSSIMPQKKNADFLELLRGVSGVFVGNLTGFMSTLKGLPSSYNRDLQWDKKFLTDSCATAFDIVQIFTKVVATLKLKESKTKSLLEDDSLYATDLADYLAHKGLPFKVAHEQVGKIINFAEENNVALSKIGLDILQKFAPKIQADVYELFDPKHSISMKKTIGSTNPKEIKKQISFWKNKLKVK